MERKKIISREALDPWIDDMSLEEARCLLEDYIKAELSDEEIYQKYGMTDLMDEPLHLLIPTFHYEGDFCPTCKRPIAHKVTRNREIQRYHCPFCEDHPKLEEMKDFLTCWLNDVINNPYNR